MTFSSEGTAGLPKEKRPGVLTDKSSAYGSKYLKNYFQEQNIGRTRCAPHHPITQGKIEPYHRSMKNRLLLAFYCLPQELEQRIGEWAAYYNHPRYHEALDNLTPADVFFGRKQEKLQQREKIKQLILTRRRKNYISQQLQNP